MTILREQDIPQEDILAILRSYGTSEADIQRYIQAKRYDPEQAEKSRRMQVEYYRQRGESEEKINRRFLLARRYQCDRCSRFAGYAFHPCPTCGSESVSFCMSFIPLGSELPSMRGEKVVSDEQVPCPDVKERIRNLLRAGRAAYQQRDLKAIAHHQVLLAQPVKESDYVDQVDNLYCDFVESEQDTSDMEAVVEAIAQCYQLAKQGESKSNGD